MGKDNHDIAHAWANDDRACRSGHMSHGDGKLYSYAAIIGAHVTYRRETRTLMSTRSYSVTTARHQSIMRQAASHRDTIQVPDIPERITGSTPPSAKTMKDAASVLFDLWQSEADFIARNLKRARKPAQYLEQLERLGEEIEKFALFARVRIPAKLRKLIDLPRSDDWQQVIQAQAEAERKQREAKEAKQRRDNETAITHWRNFEKGEGREVYRKIDRDYLRYNAGTQRIETSQFVQVPVRIARAMYDWLKTMRASGGCNSETDCNYTLMDRYSVRAVSAERFEIGCHTIYFDQVEYIAGLLGWDDLSPAARAYDDATQTGIDQESEAL